MDIVDMYQVANLMRLCDNCNAKLPHQPKYEAEYSFCTATCLMAHRIKRWRKDETLHEVKEE